MAQFDVCLLPDRTWVVDVQADAISVRSTRVVVPLLTPNDDLFANRLLSPALSINGETRLFMAPLISVARRGDLSPSIASLVADRLTIQSALNLLLNGF